MPQQTNPSDPSLWLLVDAVFPQRWQFWACVAAAVAVYLIASRLHLQSRWDKHARNRAAAEAAARIERQEQARVAQEAEAVLTAERAVRRLEIEAELLTRWKAWLLAQHGVPPFGFTEVAKLGNDRHWFMADYRRTEPADAWLLRFSTDPTVRQLIRNGADIPPPPLP